jgi:hypothetical protein
MNCRAKEEPMLPITHPDLIGQLVEDRVATLRADAQRHRRGRPFLARWRPARFDESAAGLSGVAPASAPEGAIPATCS